MSEHYIVTLDAGHLKIYVERQQPGQATVGLQPVEALDFPLGRASYSDRDTDQAGRFGSSKHQSAAQGAPSAPGGSASGRSGMSIDERLPMQREEHRRRARDLAEAIDAFFGQRPEATFDFAAGPELNGVVLEMLARPVRERVRRSVAKDIVNQPADALRAHFASAR